MPDDGTEQPGSYPEDNPVLESADEGEAKKLSHPRLVPVSQRPQREHLYHVTRRSVSMTKHQGPLPTAEYMREIQEVIPDGPERILAMAEKNADHRRKMEEKEMDSIIAYNNGLLARSNRGLAAGLVVALTFGTAAWSLISSGHEVSGSIMGGLDIVGLVSVFVIGRAHAGKPDAHNAPHERKSHDDDGAQAPRLEQPSGGNDGQDE